MAGVKKLTHKQQGFCTDVAQGATLSDAYRNNYKSDRMKQSTIHVEACKLMANPKIASRVLNLKSRQESSLIASMVSDSDKVLNKLRHLMDNAEGTPAETIMLKATDLLGKTQGMFKHVTVNDEPRSAEEIRTELNAKLDRLLSAVERPAIEHDDRDDDVLVLDTEDNYSTEDINTIDNT